MTLVDYWSIGSSEAPSGNGFDYSLNSHEIIVLLPNNNIYILDIMKIQFV